MEDQRDAGIARTNRDFARFDQVNKSHCYRLSESAQGDEQFDLDFQIQTCDMADYFDGGAAGRARFAQSLGQAMEEIGFAILSNHGVDPDLFVQAEKDVVDFFEQIPASAREPYLAKRQGSVNQGYFPIKQTTIIHPDLVEGWVFCRRAFDLDGDPDYDPRQFWPDPRFEQAFRPLVQSQERLILPIMRSILRYLGCAPDLYDERLHNTNFGFRLNYYPAPPDPQHLPSGGRMLGHEDVDLFTLLPAPSVEGLQVYNRRNGRWIRLNAPAGSIILNTGDYMQRISNDRLPSTSHRVSQPREAQALSRPRVSFPMAIYVWEDTLLEVLPGQGDPRYGPISAIEFHTRTTAKYYGDDYAVSADAAE